VGRFLLRVVRLLRRHVHRVASPHEVAVRHVHPFYPHSSNKHPSDRDGERFSRDVSSRAVFISGFATPGV
jgi:hypothetical protein